MSFPFATQDAVDKWLQSADYSSANLSISETIHVEVDAIIDTLEEVSDRDFVFIPVRFSAGCLLKKSAVLWDWEYYGFNLKYVYMRFAWNWNWRYAVFEGTLVNMKTAAMPSVSLAIVCSWRVRWVRNCHCSKSGVFIVGEYYPWLGFKHRKHQIEQWENL